MLEQTYFPLGTRCAFSWGKLIFAVVLIGGGSMIVYQIMQSPKPMVLEKKKEIKD